jgi:ABC-type uncharacterized transport system auxiliary subunit
MQDPTFGKPPADHAPRHPRWFTATLFACMLTVVGPMGCSSLLQQPAPAKGLFDVDPGPPDTLPGAPPPTTRPAGPMLQVRSATVSPPFDGTAFVYRTGPSQFSLDYYNNFVASPSALLTGSIVNWLDKAGPLPAVGAGTSLRTDLLLEPDVTRLLIDFSDPAKPQALIAVRCFLVRDRPGGTFVLMDRDYQVSAPVTANTPAGYAAAWGLALREFLQKLEADLRSADL